MIFNDKHEILLSSEEPLIPSNSTDEEGCKWIPLKNLFVKFSEPIMSGILKEYQSWNWNRRNHFCGACGANTIQGENDSVQCNSCGEKYFPAQFPVVIVLIQKEGKILLAHNANFPDGLFSTIAGFVDLGETCEEAIKREVIEEVGIKIKNIKYFGSQNWGFSTSLMLAFTAEYESGEIQVDGEEIIEADWYSKDSLPQTPPEFSIGGKLIQSFFRAHSIRNQK